MADSDDAGRDPVSDRELYEPPSIEFLGTVGDLTRGPDPGAGDVPNGVISF